MTNVDYTFLPRRRAQVFAQLNNEKDVLAAAEWLSANVPEKERDEETELRSGRNHIDPIKLTVHGTDTET